MKDYIKIERNLITISVDPMILTSNDIKRINRILVENMALNSREEHFAVLEEEFEKKLDEQLKHIGSYDDGWSEGHDTGKEEGGKEVHKLVIDKLDKLRDEGEISEEAYFKVWRSI